MGLCLHVALDLCNTFGIQLLWPFTRRRFCFDAVFFIDAVAWALTLGFFGLVFADVLAPSLGVIGYAGLFATYVLSKLVLQRRVRKRLGVDFAIPSALNPFRFFVFAQRAGQLKTAMFNALTNQSSGSTALPEATPEIVELVGKNELFRDMQSILRALHVTCVDKDPTGTTVVAQDLAVRNFGGRFGRTELHFDPKGYIVDEMAHI